MKIAIYPGTFDPITLGHLDILRRAGKLFDKIILAVAPSETKSPMFTLDERINLISENIKDMPYVSLEPLRGPHCRLCQKAQCNSPDKRP